MQARWQPKYHSILGVCALNPLQHLAYAEATVKAPLRASSHLRRIDEKRLYILAGFDDYRIAMWGRQVRPTRLGF